MKKDIREGACEATPYDEWCRHYGYDSESQQAQTDYQHYRRELALLVEVCAPENTASANRPD